MFFAGGPSSERQRSETLELEGVSTSLVQDANFERLDRLIQAKKHRAVHATITGRYFSGELIDYPAGSSWGGYGHPRQQAYNELRHRRVHPKR